MEIKRHLPFMVLFSLEMLAANTPYAVPKCATPFGCNDLYSDNDPADGVRSSMWRRDVNYDNTEFQSFLSKSTVRVLQECIMMCTVTQHCLFATFRSVTQECKVYSFLEGQVPVASTSFWKASRQCVKTEDGEALAFFPMHVPFYQANMTCVSFKGHLAILDSIEKLEEFRLIMKQKSELQSEKFWWIGGVDTISGWEWMNGQPMNTSRSFWASNNPSGNGECVRYGVVKKFDDSRCDKPFPFVCVIDQTNCYG